MILSLEVSYRSLKVHQLLTQPPPLALHSYRVVILLTITKSRAAQRIEAKAGQLNEMKIKYNKGLLCT